MEHLLLVIAVVCIVTAFSIILLVPHSHPQLRIWSMVRAACMIAATYCLVWSIASGDQRFAWTVTVTAGVCIYYADDLRHMVSPEDQSAYGDRLFNGIIILLGSMMFGSGYLGLVAF